jgi:hypothetical protein
VTLASQLSPRQQAAKVLALQVRPPRNVAARCSLGGFFQPTDWRHTHVFSPTDCPVRKHSVLLFAALALGAAGAAFKQADKNANSSLSMEEAKAMPAVSEQVKEIDTDSDGKISMAEFTTAMKK